MLAAVVVAEVGDLVAPRLQDGAPREGALAPEPVEANPYLGPPDVEVVAIAEHARERVCHRGQRRLAEPVLPAGALGEPDQLCPEDDVSGQGTPPRQGGSSRSTGP